MWGKHFNAKPSKRVQPKPTSVSNSRALVISMVTRPSPGKSNHGNHLQEVLRSGHYHLTRGVLSKLHMRSGRSNRMVHTAASQFVAGAVGGGCATYSTHWLDTIKVRMQTNPSLYPSTSKCISCTLREAGVRGLYQGALPAVAGHTVKASIVFMSYGICQETVRSLLPRRDGKDELSVAQMAGAGAMTGVLASFALCPLELVKCRMQAAGSHASGSHGNHACSRGGAVRLAASIVRREGVRGLYRGLPGMWTKEVPGSFIYFGSYEALRASMRNWGGPQLADTKTGIFACGTAAGLCYCVTHPVESVKTRVQVESSSHGFFRASYHILKTDGVRPLCRGIAPSMVRAGLFSGIQFMIYEVLRDALRPE